MDSDNNNTARSALRQPFIETANALASLYKQAAAAERDAKDAGASAAYRTIMQWAATKSTTAEQITPADVISLCAQQLSRLHRSGPTNPTERPANSTPTNVDQSPRPHESAPHPDTTPVAYIPRDDALVSDIRKLNVNPRKRQRVDISETFIRACRNNDSLIFATDNAHLLDSVEDRPNPFRMQTESNETPTSRKEANRESTLHSSQNTEFSASRKSKNVKGQRYDKLRKK